MKKDNILPLNFLLWEDLFFFSKKKINKNLNIKKENINNFKLFNVSNSFFFDNNSVKKLNKINLDSNFDKDINFFNKSENFLNASIFSSYFFKKLNLQELNKYYLDFSIFDSNYFLIKNRNNYYNYFKKLKILKKYKIDSKKTLYSSSLLTQNLKKNIDIMLLENSDKFINLFIDNNKIKTEDMSKNMNILYKNVGLWGNKRRFFKLKFVKNYSKYNRILKYNNLDFNKYIKFRVQSKKYFNKSIQNKIKVLFKHNFVLFSFFFENSFILKKNLNINNDFKFFKLLKFDLFFFKKFINMYNKNHYDLNFFIRDDVRLLYSPKNLNFDNFKILNRKLQEYFLKFFRKFYYNFFLFYNLKHYKKNFLFNKFFFKQKFLKNINFFIFPNLKKHINIHKFLFFETISLSKVIFSKIFKNYLLFINVIPKINYFIFFNFDNSLLIKRDNFFNFFKFIFFKEGFLHILNFFDLNFFLNYKYIYNQRFFYFSNFKLSNFWENFSFLFFFLLIYHYLIFILILIILKVI